LLGKEPARQRLQKHVERWTDRGENNPTGRHPRPKLQKHYYSGDEPTRQYDKTQDPPSLRRHYVSPNAAHQRHGKVARILRFAECVTL
jgi:hypothetical protein